MHPGMDGAYANEDKPNSNNNRFHCALLMNAMALILEERSCLTLIARRRQVSLVRIILFFILNFTANMRRFLFITSVMLTSHDSTADRFQKWQGHQLGLGVAHVFTNSHR